jgi:hypothetical protein
MAHHVTPDGKIYADSDFLNALHKVRGVTLKHMGFGEFYAETPKGRVDFDRMRGKDFPGQGGRSHLLYGERGDKRAPEWLVAQMEKARASDRVASDDTLRTATLQLASRHSPDSAEHKALMGALRTSGQWDDPIFDAAMKLLKGKDKDFKNALGIATRIAKWHAAGPSPTRGMQGNGASLSFSGKDGTDWWSVSVLLLGRSVDKLRVYVEATAPQRQYPGHRPMTVVAQGGLRDLDNPKKLIKNAQPPLELIMRGRERFAEDRSLHKAVVRLASKFETGSPLRRKLVGLAVLHDPDTRPLASFAKEARGDKWEKVVVGERVRIRWTHQWHGVVQIEELPGKPFKRSLRTATLHLSNVFPGGDKPNAFILENLVRSARFSKGMNFDRALMALQAAIDLAESESEGQLRDYQIRSLGQQPEIKDVFYLEVEPGSYRPIEARGKDFFVSAEWTEFEITDDSGVNDPYEGMKDFYKQKSAGAARKFYKLVSALYKSGELSRMSHDDLMKMVKKNKIGYDYVPSVWR